VILRSLTREDLGAWHGVGLGVVPLVERNPGVVGLVDTRNLDSGTELGSSRALDLELEALDVELRLADVGLVETNVLYANKVFSSRDALLDGPFKTILLPARPGGVGARAGGVGETALHDLGPVTRSIIALDIRRSLGDVDEARAGVLNLLVVEELEADLVASLDGVGGGVAGSGSLVAAEVVGVHNVVGERRVVGVAVLASVCILAADRSTVDDETVEDVVGVGTKGRNERKKSGGFHFDKGTNVVLYRTNVVMVLSLK
jgi:hypothetical protein